MPQLNLDFKTTLDYKNLNTYDITELDVAVTIQSESVFILKNVTFHIILQELDAAIYQDEKDIQVYTDLLMFPNYNADGQQTHLDEQLPNLPFEFLGEKKMDYKVKLFGRTSNAHNFLDIIKSVPNHIAKKEPKFELYIACILNAKTDTECTAYQIYKIDNPFCKITDNFRKWRLD